MRRMMLGVLTMMLGWVLAPGLAHAVALGKIDVTSHLGEPFYAEVPLTLEKGEKLSGVTVDIAQPSDYRILEVYRDPVLNAIRTNIQDDTRGARIKLVSDGAIESPFFNLVLRVHYGNATSFKKYPIFLDLPTAVVSTRKPKPEVQAPKPAPVVESTTSQPATAPAEAPAATKQKSAGKGGAPFKPFSGWARIDRYGPMVYGDTIMTVAKRLRVDNRYTIKQVMVALFDKNKDKFDKENMNLIKAGSYLKVPTAKEVEAITPRQAIKAVAEQEKQWQALKQQPRYAAVAQAQKTRYSARVKVGETAEGVPSAAASGKDAKGVALPSTGKASSAAASAPAKTAAPAPAKTTTGTTTTSSELQALQQQNDELQKKLQQADANIAALNAKLSSPDMAASQASMKKLELRLARMQTQLDAARQQAAMAAKNSVNNMLVYGLGGVVVLLLLVIGYLLRRERPHPASQSHSEPEFEEDALTEHASVSMFDEDEHVAPSAVDTFEESDEPGTSLFAGEAAFGDETEPVEDEIADVYEEESAEQSTPIEAPIEEVDQNVDYVAEADVYLRYGMEEEALRQLKMAVRQSEDNVDAYCKLTRLLHGRGDQDAFDAAVEEGKAALSGDALARFESEIAQLGGEGAAGTAADEMPDEEPGFGQEGGADLSEENDVGVEDSGLTDVGIPAGDEAEEVGEVDLSDDDSAGLDLGSLEWSPGSGDEDFAPADDSAEDLPEEKEEPSMEEDQAEHGLEWSFDAADGEQESSPVADFPSEGEQPETSEAEAEEPGFMPQIDDDFSLDEAISEAEQAYGAGGEAGVPEIGEMPETESASGDATEEAEQSRDVGQDVGSDDLLDDVELDLSGLMIDEEDVETEGEDASPAADAGEDYHAGEVSRELDELLDELGIDAEMNDAVADTGSDEQPSAEPVSAASLAIDMARSLVARGMLDDAESSFQSALEGDFRGQALLGLAEVAQARGDMEQAAGILTEAEPLLDDSSREWFETLKEKQGE